MLRTLNKDSIWSQWISRHCLSPSTLKTGNKFWKWELFLSSDARREPPPPQTLTLLGPLERANLNQHTQFQDGAVVLYI
jgi:hypothetical protein